MLPEYEKRLNEEQDLNKRVTALENALANKANTKIIYNCDFNELKKQGTGIYIGCPTTKNSPHEYTNGHYYVIQICFGEYCVQVLNPLNGAKQVWLRQGRVNNGWDAWTQLHSY